MSGHKTLAPVPERAWAMMKTGFTLKTAADHFKMEPGRLEIMIWDWRASVTGSSVEARARRERDRREAYDRRMLAGTVARVVTA
ncbi:hypothetical protein KOAAANKH_02558 [Brevundimonas sp. NIBR10]|uniref:hypothetical protein n=1 Tax=Brevundimonas sp. NIBR10 TaxID=3015997 RepID=UPI0022F17556|nr:hypothetical protein [Brevundimonas sp. NIBR10]WGM47676.1 hypothetical protein KOAAANKH_02558 [Brevundimonas sp. NIBR10]